MPPTVPRKRLRSSSPDNKITRGKAAKSRASQGVSANRRKETLFDDLDATASSHLGEGSSTSLNAFKDDDSDSPLTVLSDEDFEDVPLAKRLKTERPTSDAEDEDEEDEDDDDVEFEDVVTSVFPIADAPMPTGDLELTLNRDSRISLTSQSNKKGPTKIERKVRIATHCIHVLSLLWHNAVRNSWLCDPEVQAIVLSHLPPRMWDEVERWRRNSGLVENHEPKQRPKGRGKKGKEREFRDWGQSAQKLEEGAVDMSHGDPLFRFMKSLVAWWKQRYRVTSPGLRKWGYMSLDRLDRLTKAHKDHADQEEQFGELVRGLHGFRQCALLCRGSRDVGAQLFVALLRALGLDARMVASLQPLGFGWNKLEDAEKEDEPSSNSKSPASGPNSTQKPKLKKEEKGGAKGRSTGKRRPETRAVPKSSRSTGTRTQTEKHAVVSSEDELGLEMTDSDDESVVEMQVTLKKDTSPVSQFDKDLEYPHYWAEVLSPVTSKYLPIDPVAKGTIATNADLLEMFEPRGAKADKARQVVCYIIGHSDDGTAKDVTVRYLKRQVLPGRTKGSRMPLEKVPVYDRHGKVKRHETFDWVKSALSGYRRGGKHHPLTDVDQQEDSTDLQPAKPEKKEVKEGEETLQYYKQSADFVLRRHLKREEALRPAAEAVRVFRVKGKGGKTEEEDVYLRSDVVNVKSAETWHKQGRAPTAGERPLKMVPYRAATLNRKREISEMEAATGQKVQQGLYSHEQTDWIIPPPIRDGVIPKNEYGNIDMFVEHMCPRGAVHVPYRGVVKVCKRLEVDYAEAVVDFEFGHRMAIPVIQGAVIAEEHYDRVMEELEKDEAERVRKEDEKRRKAALAKWRKFLMGMRIVQRIRLEYGEIDESVSVFGHSGADGRPSQRVEARQMGEEDAGGFLPEGYEEEELDTDARPTSSFFPTLEEGEEHGGEDDGLIMEHGVEHAKEHAKEHDGEMPEPDSRFTRSARARRGK